MKTRLLFFAMLASVAASAQTTVQITPVSATYTTTPTIQFKVSWTNQTTTNHRNKVWVFVDFQTVISPAQQCNWQPATITGAVQKTAGTVSGQTERGFFLEGTTTNFSSTVTVLLSNISSTKFNWCTYSSDYPPNAASYSDGKYTLKGTQPFIINGASVYSNEFAGVINSMTDATGCPGGVGKDVVHNGGVCADGLIAFSTHCRDVITDEASTYAGLGIEIKEKYIGSHANCDCTTGCPADWRYPTLTEVEHMNSYRTIIWGSSIPWGTWISGECKSWPPAACKSSYTGIMMRVWYFGDLMDSSCGVFAGKWKWWGIYNYGMDYYQPLLCVR